MKRVLVLVLLVAAVGGAGAWYFDQGANGGSSFRTVAVERGDLVATISATGTIEPEEVIDVGAQVAGQILSFGADPRGSDRIINFGSPVEKGTVLARIDESLYKTMVDRARAMVEQGVAQVDSSQAQVAVAQANVERAEADLGQMQAKLTQTERDYQRVRRLRVGTAIADADVDLAESAYLTNKAALAVGKATVAQTRAAQKDADANVAKAKATLADARANLENAETNLRYCTIVSPVKGVIVDRRVNIGQTVVSSLTSPSLFLIAKDLKRLQVWASVNEADIGNVYSGQPVTFTVDAHPGRVFKGVVAPDQPRLNASMTQNVVTYTVVVNTDNTDGKLLPYLTANLQFEVSKRHNTLLVPNAALRWTPNPKQVVPEARAEFVTAQRRTKTAPGEKPSAAAAKEPHDRATLWVEDGEFVRPVRVKTGLTDGAMTEILSGEIQDGDAVVTGENRSGGAGGSSNPFAPKLFGGKKGG
jgi:HlyD family secretion protein